MRTWWTSPTCRRGFMTGCWMTASRTPSQPAIRYLLVDEYQDTTHIQERILLRLARAHGNLCVVGDDDQGIYRFRGASVRNLLEFPEHFPDCRTVELIHQLPQQSGYRPPRPTASWPRETGPTPTAARPSGIPKPSRAHAPDAHADYPAVIAVADRGGGGTRRTSVASWWSWSDS